MRGVATHLMAALHSSLTTQVSDGLHSGKRNGLLVVAEFKLREPSDVAGLLRFCASTEG